VALGESHACVLREDRKVECWGSNSRNELGIGVAYEACFLDEGGQKLICSDGPRRTEPGHHGNRVFDAVVKGLNDVADLALGDSMSCARHEDGKVSCWGSEWGGTPRRVDGIPLVNQLAVGGRRLCGVAQDGAAFCLDSSHQIKWVQGIPSVTQLSVGPLGHVCAITQDHSLYCWGGANEFGEIGVGTFCGSYPVPQRIF
jgi:alpha-tubulin suppressor-like RCC1 family protein